MKLIEIQDFLQQMNGDTLLIDARSPSEFAHAHIPGAVNIPLMSDQERHLVGTEYKQHGRVAAVLLGYRLVGPQFESKLRQILAFKKKSYLVYCWRGGLRSNLLAHLIQSAGHTVNRLDGGYKAYRSLVLDIISRPRQFLVLGGKTGSGKTEMLKHLKSFGEAVIDLEALANHRGSAFGGLGLGPQPGYEFFENTIAMALASIPEQETIWIENESRMIGKLKVPDLLYKAMRGAPVIDILLSVEERVSNILSVYGKFPSDNLKAATEMLQRKMGGLRLGMAIQLLEEGKMEEWVSLLLTYYDENYAYSSSLRNPATITPLELSGIPKEERIQTIIALKAAVYGPK